MITLVVLRLLARRSFWITAAVWLLLISALLVTSRTPLYLDDRHIQTVFRFVYTAFTIGSLLALGGFVARAVADLERVRLSKTIPGLRRRVNQAVIVLVPCAAATATVFLYVALTDQFGRRELLPVFGSSALLFSLGLGLGWSWLQFIVLAGFLWKIRWFFAQLQTNPLPYSLIAAGICALLLQVRHRRFLRGTGDPRRGPWSWLAMAFSIGETPWRSEKALPDRPDWNDPIPGIRLPKLIKAGAWERLGHGAWGLAGRTWLSTIILWVIYTALVFWASAGQNLISTGEFFVQVFIRGNAHPVTDVMRLFFAITTGAMAFLCALLLDPTLKPNLWHPVSRHLRARAVFFSHLRQNAIFAVIHVSTAFVVVALFGVCTRYSIGLRPLNGFVFPAIYAFVLMPIPQAVFANGVDLFRAKADPKTQFLAGIIGGSFSLLVGYWTYNWPLRIIHDQLSFGPRFALLVVTTAVVYAGYYHFLVARFSKGDLRWRTA